MKFWVSFSFTPISYNIFSASILMLGDEKIDWIPHKRLFAHENPSQPCLYETLTTRKDDEEDDVFVHIDGW